MAKRIEAGLKILGADEAKQDIRAIRKETEDWGEAGERAADGLTKQFQNVEKGVSKIGTAIAQGRSVSEKDLEKMRTSYSLLSSTIEETFGSLENAPKAVQEAFQKAETQITAAKAGVDKVEDATAKAAARFDELGKGATSAGKEMVDSLEKTGAATTETAKKFASIPEQYREEFERTEKAIDKFNRKLQEDADVSKEDIEKVWKAQALLNDRLKEGGVRVEDLGDEAKIAFQKFEDEADKAAKTVRKLEDTVRSNEDAVRSSFEGFSSVGDAIQQLGGPIGKLTLGIGGVVGALGVGWQTGKQFAELIGTDFSELDAITEDLSRRVGNLVENLSDSAVSLFTGEWDELSKSLTLARASIVLTDEALSGLRSAQAAGVKDLIDLTDKNKELEEIERIRAQTLAAGAEGQAVWDEATKRHNGTNESFLFILRALQPELDGITARQKAATEAVEAAKEVTTNYVAAINQQAAALDELSKQIGETEKKQEEATEATRAAELEQSKAKVGLNDAEGAVRNYESALERASTQLSEQKQRVAELRKERQDGDPILKQAIEKEQQLNGLVDTHRQKLADARAEIAKRTTALGQAAAAVEQARKVEQGLTEDLGKQTDQHDAETKSIKEKQAVYAQYQKAVQEGNTELQELWKETLDDLLGVKEKFVDLDAELAKLTFEAPISAMRTLKTGLRETGEEAEKTFEKLYKLHQFANAQDVGKNVLGGGGL